MTPGHGVVMVRSAAATRLAAAAERAAGCRACPLWEHAEQVVFGEGPGTADLVLVGEQPGDVEDRQGRPFVGPAGRLLDQALATAGVDRERIYVTNAVKHFKWKPRGKRRIHQTPNTTEVGACRPWLEEELEIVAPRAVVAMGTTAVRSVLGTRDPIRDLRGRVIETGPPPATIVTVHPSSILRLDGGDREAALAGLVDDLKLASATVDAMAGGR